MNKAVKKKLISYLCNFITDNKKVLLDEVLSKRTRQITAVLENIYQPQNASAVVRTCECLGVQELHIIENYNSYTINPKVTLGSTKWIDLIRFSRKENNTLDCINHLKNLDYRIIGTVPHKNDQSLESLKINGKMAFLFGNEKEGLSEEAIASCDEFVKIPMFGFTESYNLSVSAAIILHYAMSELRSQNESWTLSEDEKNDLKLKWLKKILRRYDLLEAQFLKKLRYYLI